MRIINEEEKSVETAGITSSNPNKLDAMNVGEFSVKTIIMALHQAALDKSNAASKKARVLNSAIDDGKKEMMSAGEHCISVVPLDPEKQPLLKTDAVQILKDYVQWFIGPDLSKKITDKQVKELDTLKEALKPIPTYKMFLLEAEEDGEEDGEEDEDVGDGTSKPEPDEEKPEKSTDGEKPEDGGEKPKDNEEGKDKDGEEGEESEDKENGEESSKIGYYIPYDLKVEGMKQSSAFVDALKKSIKTLGDDITIKASGIFGGGDSFKVKDIKNKVKGMFTVDPDELEENLSKQIRIDYPETDVPSIQVQSTKTLLVDLKNDLDAQQKSKLGNAKYALKIKLMTDDPKHTIFNPGVIAQLVNSSLGGLLKKGLFKVSKDDVIHIENYKDDHKDTEALRKLILKLDYENFHGEVKGNRIQMNNLIKKIDEKFEKIHSDKQFKSSSLTTKAWEIWDKWKARYRDHHEFNDTTQRTAKYIDERSILKTFFEEYKKFYEKNKEAISRFKYSMNESTYKDFQNWNSKNQLRNMIMHVLYEDEPPEEDASPEDDGDSGSKGDDEGSGDEPVVDKEKILNKMKSVAKVEVEKQFPKEEYNKAPPKQMIDSIDQIKEKLDSLYSMPSDFDDHFKKDGEDFFKYGIMLDFVKELEGLMESKNAGLKSEIMKMLLSHLIFEAENPEKPKLKAITEEMVKKFFDIVCSRAGISEENIGEDFEFDTDGTGGGGEDKKPEEGEEEKPEDSEEKKPEEGDAEEKKADDGKDEGKDDTLTESRVVEYRKDSIPEDKLSAINHDFNMELIKYIKSKIKSKEKNLSGKPFTCVGTTEKVEQFLKDRGIMTSDLEDTLSHVNFAAVHVMKSPKKVNRKGKEVTTSSTGYKLFNNKDLVLKIFEQAANDKIKINTRSDESKNKIIEYTVTADTSAKKYLKCQGTTIPADCRVRIILFDGLEKNGPKPNPGPGPGPGPGPEPGPEPDPDTDGEKTKLKIWIRPFAIPGKDPEPPKPPEPTDDDTTGEDDDQHVKTPDLYIIPLPRIKFRDKEYDTYA